MESNPENSMISFSSTENSMAAPCGKRQKTLSSKDCNHSYDASHQVVIYNNEKSDKGQHEQDEVHFSVEPSMPSKQSKRASAMYIGAFAVQCAKCQKWRLVSTKEKYEEIRERILENPFICEKAREWKPDVKCNDPSDVSQDGSNLWAIDKPNIAQAPPGWERLIKIRGEGSTKFADVYYVSPSGIKLRSTNEVEKYLAEHPAYVAQGVKLSKFSFKTPAPLQKDYVRKRSQANKSDLAHPSLVFLWHIFQPLCQGPCLAMVPFHETTTHHHHVGQSSNQESCEIPFQETAHHVGQSSSQEPRAEHQCAGAPFPGAYGGLPPSPVALPTRAAAERAGGTPSAAPAARPRLPLGGVDPLAFVDPAEFAEPLPVAPPGPFLGLDDEYGHVGSALHRSVAGVRFDDLSPETSDFFELPHLPPSPPPFPPPPSSSQL